MQCLCNYVICIFDHKLVYIILCTKFFLTGANEKIDKLKKITKDHHFYKYFLCIYKNLVMSIKLVTLYNLVPAVIVRSNWQQCKHNSTKPQLTRPNLNYYKHSKLVKTYNVFQYHHSTAPFRDCIILTETTYVTVLC